MAGINPEIKREDLIRKANSLVEMGYHLEETGNELRISLKFKNGEYLNYNVSIEEFSDDRFAVEHIVQRMNSHISNQCYFTRPAFKPAVFERDYMMGDFLNAKKEDK